MREVVRVAVAEVPATPCDISANVKTAINAMRTAATKGAHLIVFPELHLSGYDLAAIAASPERAAVALGSPHLGPLQHECASLAVAAVIGACIRRPDGLTNSAIIISSSGNIAATYDKINLWETERRLFVRGKRLVVTALGPLRVGVAICYDAGFPEHVRALARRGADLIVCPSAFAQGEEEHRYHLYFPARALENTVFVAVANLTGKAGRLKFFGKSAIFDPTGRLLARARGRSSCALADITKTRLNEVRRKLSYLTDLQSDLYTAKERSQR